MLPLTWTLLMVVEHWQLAAETGEYRGIALEGEAHILSALIALGYHFPSIGSNAPSRESSNAS